MHDNTWQLRKSAARSRNPSARSRSVQQRHRGHSVQQWQPWLLRQSDKLRMEKSAPMHDITRGNCVNQRQEVGIPAHEAAPSAAAPWPLRQSGNPRWINYFSVGTKSGASSQEASMGQGAVVAFQQRTTPEHNKEEWLVARVNAGSTDQQC